MATLICSGLKGRANTRLVQLCARAQEDVKPSRPSGPNSPSKVPEVTAEGFVRVSALLLKRTFFKKWHCRERGEGKRLGKRGTLRTVAAFWTSRPTVYLHSLLSTFQPDFIQDISRPSATPGRQGDRDDGGLVERRARGPPVTGRPE